jgi:hypothetical protein
LHEVEGEEDMCIGTAVLHNYHLDVGLNMDLPRGHADKAMVINGMVD